MSFCRGSGRWRLGFSYQASEASVTLTSQGRARERFNIQLKVIRGGFHAPRPTHEPFPTHTLNYHFLIMTHEPRCRHWEAAKPTKAKNKSAVVLHHPSSWLGYSLSSHFWASFGLSPRGAAPYSPKPLQVQEDNLFDAFSHCP